MNVHSSQFRGGLAGEDLGQLAHLPLLEHQHLTAAAATFIVVAVVIIIIVVRVMPIVKVIIIVKVRTIVTAQ